MCGGTLDGISILHHAFGSVRMFFIFGLALTMLLRMLRSFPFWMGITENSRLWIGSALQRAKTGVLCTVAVSSNVQVVRIHLA